MPAARIIPNISSSFGTVLRRTGWGAHATLATVCASVLALSACGGGASDPANSASASAPFGPWVTAPDVLGVTLRGTTDTAAWLQFVPDHAGGLLAYSTRDEIAPASGVVTRFSTFWRFSPAVGWGSPVNIAATPSSTLNVIPFRDAAKQDGVMIVQQLGISGTPTIERVVYDGNRWMLTLQTAGPSIDYRYTLMADGSLLRTHIVREPTLYAETSKFSNGAWQPYKLFPIQVTSLTAEDTVGNVALYEHRDGVYAELSVARPSGSPGDYPCGAGSVVQLSGSSSAGSTLTGTRIKQTYCSVHQLLAFSNALNEIVVTANGSLSRLNGDPSFPHASVRTGGEWVESNVYLNSASSQYHAYTDRGQLMAFGQFNATQATYDPTQLGLLEGESIVTLKRESDGTLRPAIGYSGPISQTAQIAAMKFYPLLSSAASTWSLFERLGVGLYLEHVDFAPDDYNATHVIESGNAQFVVLQKGFPGAADPGVVRVKWRSR